jgi:hypothetical protein
VTCVLGAVLFTGHVGGAILTHLRIGEDMFLQITLSRLIWLRLYLRDPPSRHAALEETMAVRSVT